jgi:hypothetical protein
MRRQVASEPHTGCPHLQPLSHRVGEGCRGARRCALPLSRPAGEGDTGGEGDKARLLRRGEGVIPPPLTGAVIPIAEANFTKSRAIDDPLLKVPHARRGNRMGARLGSPREAGGTCRRGAVVNSVLAIGIRSGSAGLFTRFATTLALTLALSAAATFAQVKTPPLLTPAGVVPSIEIPQEALSRSQRPETTVPRAQPAETPPTRPQRRNTLDAFSALRSWETLQEEFRRTVSISGHKSIGYHLNDVEGDFAAFRDQNYFGQGGQRVTDNTDLTIRVNKFLGFLSFDWRWSNNRFRNPYDARITYTYESPNLRLEWGDITASLGSANPLVGFNRTLKGATATATWGRSRFRYIASETKAAARTITIQGNDSPGPYYLQGSQIVDGSERVQVDGVEKRRGEDYTIDYFGGILRFRDGMIIPRTSTIVVTYETYAFNSAPSRLQGFRVESNLGGGFNLGFTMVSQKSTVRVGLRRRTERFFGFEAPTTPYDLQFPPLRDANNPIIITVGGVPQVEGVDYYFDERLPYRFYFTRYMPRTLIIQVEYTPRPDPSSTIGGDREVMGIDLTLPLGRVGQPRLERGAEPRRRARQPTGGDCAQRHRALRIRTPRAERDLPRHPRRVHRYRIGRLPPQRTRLPSRPQLPLQRDIEPAGEFQQRACRRAEPYRQRLQRKLHRYKHPEL